MTDNSQEQQSAPTPPPDPGSSSGKSASPPPRTWMQTHGRDLKFIVIFVVMMSIYYVTTTTDAMNKQFFPWYLAKTAEVSGWLLKTAGYDNVRVVGVAMDTIDKTKGTITVERGCDAIAPTALFLSAVVASPPAISSKLIAIFLGTSLLMFVNVIRIITLFLTAVHWPKIFDLMHLDVWQWAFIALAVLLWGVWASWASKRQRRLAAGA